ncbi:MAG: putative protein kinase domain protein [Streblomastix strix]|uniref:non-specific serine/threonine protein kinase n=1 Tax=Streblomastix strix TaxID=222440 RepID=A0A5J4WFY2_9EUKA|nr:MAG: putative protein kinase domain protein [Streblomastix strix]
MCLITEYYSRGDLRKVIKELQQFQPEYRINIVWEISAQIILALNFMHSKGVLHRNIKPENIFIMKDGSVRLGDFSLTKDILEMDEPTTIEAQIYKAPEVQKDNEMDFGSDLYAIGVIVFEMLTGKNPFAAKSESEIIKRIENGQSGTLPDLVPSELKELIKSLMNIV